MSKSYLAKDPKNIVVLLSATALVKLNLKKKSMIGVEMPPPPTPAAIVNVKMMNSSAQPIYSVLAIGKAGLWMHTLADAS